jgi:hypothetical protein
VLPNRGELREPVEPDDTRSQTLLPGIGQGSQQRKFVGVCFETMVENLKNRTKVVRHQDSVVPFARNHISHSASRICYIPFVARYQMNVCMFHGLPCCQSTVDSHIEA